MRDYQVVSSQYRVIGQARDTGMQNAAAKRTIDVVGASIGLVAFAIPMVAVALLVRLTLGSPVIYRQPRPGLHGRTFEIFKFRTMRDTTDADGKLLPNRLRVTPVGHFLRRTSLDELPELVNVLRGEMSLVGPRPLRVEYLDRYTPEQARRHDVMPGITGWAQVNGRNALDWNERLALDVWYVDNASPWLDFKILFKTVVHLLRGSDRSEDGLDVTEFLGTTERKRDAPLSRVGHDDGRAGNSDVSDREFLPGSDHSRTERSVAGREGIYGLGGHRRAPHVSRDAVRDSD